MQSPCKRGLAAITILWLSMALPMAPNGFAQGAAIERVAPAARAAVARGGRVRVLVVFDVPELETPQGRAMRGSPQAVARIAEARERVLARVPEAELEVVHAFDHLNAIAAHVDAAGLERLANSPDVQRVDLDLGGGGHLNQAIPLASVDILNDFGLSGDGVTVAVIDSGYDSDHPDLADDLVAEACFCTGCCPGGVNTLVGPGSAEDDHGHGTNVSGIVTGAGGIAPAGGAPDVGVVAVKVLDNNNSFCCTSDVVAGLDWVIQNRPDVDLVNMSLGTFALFAGDCDNANATIMTLAAAIDSLDALGVTVFASSGNDGSGTSMSAPACVANAISVGAVWDANLGSQQTIGCTETSTAADQVTCFSNSSATTDLFAPGAKTSATGMGGAMSTFTGTSQATPLAVACAALLLEADPALTPADVESVLVQSTTLVNDPTNGLDFPRLDCHEALLTVPEPDVETSLISVLMVIAAARRVFGRGAPRRAARQGV